MSFVPQERGKKGANGRNGAGHVSLDGERRDIKESARKSSISIVLM